jgi:hypothetical protein
MNDISASFETLLRRAHMTAEDYLIYAISDIEKHLGEGAAEKYPQIVAAYMQTAAIDYTGAILAQQVRLGLDAIAGAIDNAT